MNDGNEPATLDAPITEPSPLEHVERRVHHARSTTLYRTTARRTLDVAPAVYRQELPDMDSIRSTDSTEHDVLPAQSLAPRMLHVLNGDSTRYKFERSDVPGTFAVWADVLHEGPVPADLDDERFREVRARFVATAGWEDRVQALDTQRRWDARIETFADYDEVVLWFEHDLFDQLILIRHLDWFGRRDLGRTGLSLICIGQFPGVQPFHGLGQLSPEQLASLLGTRQRVTVRQTELGRAAWRAFTSDDPTAIERLLDRDTSALPFLAGALTRFLEEYPTVGSGLPRTERQILDGVARGITSPLDLFLELQKTEERVYMGDSTFWMRVKGLARGAQPLVRMSGEPVHQALPAGAIEITDAGRRVLAGDADWIELDGIDRWLGGVHLQGRAVRWRWDPRARRLVTSA